MVADAELAHLVEALPDAVVLVRDGVVAWANVAAQDMLGYGAGELVRQPIETVLVARPEILGHRSAALTGEWTECEVRHRDGRELPVEVAVIRDGSGRDEPGRDEPGRSFALVMRDVALRRSLVSQLVANTELMSAMSRGAGLDETMRLAAHHLRTIVQGDVCWVALTPPGEPRLAVVARDDAPGALRSEPSQPDADHTGVGDDEAGDAGPLLVVELGHAELAGLIAVARRRGAPDFTDRDRDVATQFAAVIAMALDLDTTRRRAAGADAIAERARIARDLHDTVMQRLFAEGLLLETAVPLAPSQVAERINSVVCNLDDVIREIRETIFEPSIAPARSA